MPFKKGQSGNPGGQWAERPFREALRMEIAQAGADHKALRRVASALLKKAEEGDIQAIRELADRLDGKPAQGVITPPALPEGDPVPQRQPEAVEAIVARFESAIARQRAAVSQK